MNSPSIKSKVDIPAVRARDYTDCIQFFRDIIHFHQRRRKGYTLRQIGQRCGFSSSGYLSMLLRKKRALTRPSVESLCRELNVSASDKKYLQSLLDVPDETKSNHNGHPASLKRTLFSFSPIFFGTENVNTRLPDKWKETLKNKTYWIFGTRTAWNHIFFLDAQTDALGVMREHGHPSKSTLDIHYFSKELLLTEEDWIFVFWPEPTPQFHSFPISEKTLTGNKFDGSVSGISHKYTLVNRPAKASDIIHRIRYKT